MSPRFAHRLPALACVVATVLATSGCVCLTETTPEGIMSCAEAASLATRNQDEELSNQGYVEPPPEEGGGGESPTVD